jgi:hypothetical protein
MPDEVLLWIIDVVESRLKILSGFFLVTRCCIVAEMRNQTQVKIWSLKLNARFGKLRYLLISHFRFMLWDASE